MAASNSLENDGVFPFSVIYGQLKDILACSNDSILIMMQDRARKYAIDTSKRPSGPWIKDNDLHAKLIALKGWADVVSKSCTKLTIIVSKVPAVENIKSILAEMCDQVSSFVGSYMSLTECSCGNPLFISISTKVRGELLQVSDLISILSKGAMNNANTATGMVWKTCENIQNLPLSNKAAYRRSIMEKMTIIKDTIREFEEYLDISKSKMESMIADLNIDSGENDATMMVGDEIEGQEDEEEEEEEESDDVYDVNDIGTVENSISLMKAALETLRTGLLVITLVADKNSRSPDIPDVTATSASLSPAVSSVGHEILSGSRTIDIMSCDDDSYSCNQWVADVSHYSDVIEGSLTDFGAELYPPLNSASFSVLRTVTDGLKNHLNSYISLLKMKSSYHEDAVVLIRNVLQHESICITK